MLRVVVMVSVVVGAIAPAMAASPVPSLSYFKREARGMAWVRLDGGKQEHVIAAFPAFGQPETAWNKAGTEAIVLITGDDDAEHAYRVALPSGKSAPLKLPTVGEVVQLGFDPQGRPLALTAESSFGEGARKPVTKGKSSYFVYGGKQYAIDTTSEGTPELEHAFRFENGAWREFETKVSTSGWDYAMRTQALDAYATLGPRSEKQREDLRLDLKDVTDPALKKRLNAIAPRYIDAEYSLWGGLKLPGGPLYVLQEQGEFVHSTNVMAWGDGARVTRVAGLDVPNAKEVAFAPDRPGLRFVDATRKGDWVLVVTTGAEGHPRLFDGASRKLVYRSDDAVDVCFWP